MQAVYLEAGLQHACARSKSFKPHILPLDSHSTRAFGSLVTDCAYVEPFLCNAASSIPV